MINRIATTSLAAALLSLAAVDGLSAQDQWRFTPFVSAGDFTSQIAERLAAIDVTFEGIGGADDASVEAVFGDGYEFDTFTGVGATLMWRRNRIGVEGSLGWVPTRAVALNEAQVIPARVARALGFVVPEGDEDFPVPARLKTEQNLVIPTLGLTYFFNEWRPGRPPPPFEIYVTGGIGSVFYLDDEPVLSAAGDDWNTPVIGMIGVGAYLNLTSSLAVRVDLRDHFWSVDFIGESNLQNSIAFSPGLTFIL